MTQTDVFDRAVPAQLPDEPIIGPHAIVHVARVIQEWFGEDTAGAILAQSTPFSLKRLPQGWVREQHAKALTAAVHRAVGPRWAATVFRDAGRRAGLAVAAPSPTSIEYAVTIHAALFAGPHRPLWIPPTSVEPALLSIRDGGPHCSRDTGSLTTFFSAALEQLLRVQLPAPSLRVTELPDPDCARRDYRFQVIGIPPDVL